MKLPPPPRRWARLGLLCAALLHLVMGAAGPWAHFRAEAAYAQRAEREGVPADRRTLPPHHEAECVVCHALGSVAAPANVSVLPLARIVADAPIAVRIGRPADPVPTHTRARAPPRLS